MITTREISVEELIERYPVLLLDAYGVLVNSTGPLPGAAGFIEELNRIGKPYFLLTNDASKLPQTAASRYRGFGLAVEPDRIITSAALLDHYFMSNNLPGSRCAVLGPEDSRQYVRDAGGEVVSPDDGFDVVVIADEAGYSFVETVDKVITELIHKVERQEKFNLVLPNPDLIYPKGDRGFGITSGSIALVIEAALQLRYPNRPGLCFDRLGKPNPDIFQEARRRSGTENMVMVGDQLETDIRGAREFGLDSVLVDTGVADPASGTIPGHLQPTYRMRSIGLRERI